VNNFSARHMTHRVKRTRQRGEPVTDENLYTKALPMPWRSTAFPEGSIRICTSMCVYTVLCVCVCHLKGEKYVRERDGEIRERKYKFRKVK
jgi:hypothetical protein